jgi:hypothetical protein
MVLRVVNDWRSVDSFDIHNIARSVTKPHSFHARTVGIVSTLSTRNTAAFHPVLTFQPFRDAEVWHPHCLNRMGSEVAQIGALA